MNRPCECGCGEPVTAPTRFVKGHNARLQRKPTIERVEVACACGCGELVTTPDKRGNKVIWVRGHNSRKRVISARFKLHSRAFSEALDDQPMTVLCSHCPWTHDGSAKNGKRLFRTHLYKHHRRVYFDAKRRAKTKATSNLRPRTRADRIAQQEERNRLRGLTL